MPVTTGDNAREINDIQKRLTVVEQQQIALQGRYDRLQKDSDTVSEDMKNDYVTKREFQLSMENQALTIQNLKLTVDTLVTKVGTLETNITGKVEDIVRSQQKEQQGAYRRTIILQTTILLAILSAFLAAAIPYLLSHH